MRMGRIIVIGDIHGCYDELTDLLEKVRLDPEDRVVAVGDLTVKGPKNLEVLELFRSDSRFSSVIGNHDLALVRHWQTMDSPLKTTQKRAFDELLRGGTRTLEYLSSLPAHIDLGSHVVVHAGLRPGMPLNLQAIDDLVELRTLGPDRTSREGTPWYEAYDDVKTVLFGHWPAAQPRRGQNAIGLDTGCVYGYQLTAYVIETQEFVSVQARAIYQNPSQQKTDRA